MFCKHLNHLKNLMVFVFNGLVSLGQGVPESPQTHTKEHTSEQEQWNLQDFVKNCSTCNS